MAGHGRECRKTRRRAARKLARMAAQGTPIVLLTPREAADVLKLSIRTIRRMIEDGRLVAYRTHPGNGGRIRLKLDDVLASLKVSQV